VEQFRLSFDQHKHSGGFAADAGDCRGGKDAFDQGESAGILTANQRLSSLINFGHKDALEWKRFILSEFIPEQQRLASISAD
jgi:hypothetical protein